MEKITRSKLEHFLEQDVPDLKNKKIWIGGAGNTALLYQEGFMRLEAEGFRIEGYCDNNSQKRGKLLGEKPIISFSELQGVSDAVVLIGTVSPTAIEEMKKQLNQLQIENYLLDDVILKQHKTEVLQCYDALYDEESKDIYANVILCRAGGVLDYIVTEGEDYFVLEPFAQQDKEEVFVDCGAYIGDTLETYVHLKKGVFKKIIAFEPDKINCEKAQKCAEQLREQYGLTQDSIVVYPCGVGSESQVGSFAQDAKEEGLGSKFISSPTEEGEQCQIVALDEFLANEDWTFLKADVESYEYKLLLGAQKTIKQKLPLLAICIYHNAVDLYSVPLLIKQIAGEYKLAIRHQSDCSGETRVYAWYDEGHGY